MYHSFFIHSSTDGHLGYFPLLEIVNDVAGCIYSFDSVFWEESRLTAVGRGGWGNARTEKKRKTSWTQNNVGIAREWGVEEDRWGCWGINGDGWRLDLGWWTHNTVYRWCAVDSCTWNLCDLVTSVTPNRFNKKGEKEKELLAQEPELICDKDSFPQ